MPRDSITIKKQGTQLLHDRISRQHDVISFCVRENLIYSSDKQFPGVREGSAAPWRLSVFPPHRRPGTTLSRHHTTQRRLHTLPTRVAKVKYVKRRLTPLNIRVSRRGVKVTDVHHKVWGVERRLDAICSRFSDKDENAE